MIANAGIGPGFDTIRIALAISIVCWHSIEVSYGAEVAKSHMGHPFGAVTLALLPMFFALSGFLVAGSALRVGDLKHFIALRGLRIVPALSVEIVLSALMLGCALTTLPVREYLMQWEFFEYFGSVVGRIRTTLPGVFDGNPTPRTVNSALWTIAPELLCYVYVAILMLLGIFHSKRLATIIALALTAASFAVNWPIGVARDGDILPPDTLVLAFVYGNLIYLWRHRIPYSTVAFSVCALIGLFGIRAIGTVHASIFCLTYCIIYLGFVTLPNLHAFRTGDYSYGVYLYGYPIQQTVSYALPDLREWYWNLAIALPLTILMAAASWHMIEKRALALRHRLQQDAETKTPGSFATYLVLLMLSAYAFFLGVQSRIIWSDDVRGLAVIVFVSAAVAAAAIVLLLPRIRKTCI